MTQEELDQLVEDLLEDLRNLRSNHSQDLQPEERILLALIPDLEEYLRSVREEPPNGTTH